MKITIDDQTIPVKEGTSVLEAALDAGIYIPHLCKHPDLEALGGCRLCSVELHNTGEIVPSCKTMVADGMQISVASPKADAVRKLSMELILATHPADCTGCPKYGKCELQSMYQYMGVGPERWRRKTRTVPDDDSNPLIQHLFTRCVRCGRCIRACQDLRGVGVLDYQRTKYGIRAGVKEGMSLKDAGCKFCGACIAVCPTGSIMDAVGFMEDDVAYNDAVVPCRAACPAGTDVPRYVRYVQEGKHSQALAVLREKLPFPATLGRICNHICEDSCKRKQLGEPVSICRIKRAATDADSASPQWKERAIQLPPTGKKVAVVGAGPAGLTAAYYLSKKGHAVTVYEENEKAGGQCRYGIPAYRLPDDVLDQEIEEIVQTGVELQLHTAVAAPVQLLEKGYQAVLVATGTHRGALLPIPGHTLDGVMVNTDFLKAARKGTADTTGKRVMVLGGGNVAYDCARTALRLGAAEVHLACIETREAMPATQEEIEEGHEEGVILHDASSCLQITGSDVVEGVELQHVADFHFDEQGKAVLSLEEGSRQILPVDCVIFAVGQKPKGTEQMGLPLVKGVYLQVDDAHSTGTPGVFAAGDVVTGTDSVIAALAAGRRSAEAIDRYLGGDGDISEQLVDCEVPDPWIGWEEGFADRERVQPHLLDPAARAATFACVEDAFTDQEAAQEAGRCLQCDLRLCLEKPKLWNEYGGGSKQ